MLIDLGPIRIAARPVARPVVRSSASSFAKKCPYGCLTQG